MQRRLAALAFGLLILLLGLPATAVASPGEESEFVALINQSRAANGLAPLSVYDDLIDDARRHTAAMIAQGSIFHSTSAELSAATTGWSLLGENVGMGPDPSILHAAFMNSPSHRANILGAFHRVGVGAERAPDGTLFVTVIFMQLPAAPAPAPTTTTTAPPTTTATAPAAPAPAPAGEAPRPIPVPVEASLRPTSAAPAAERIEVAAEEAVPGETTGLVTHDHPGPGICVRIKPDGFLCIE